MVSLWTTSKCSNISFWTVIYFKIMHDKEICGARNKRFGVLPNSLLVVSNSTCTDADNKPKQGV